MRRLLRLSFGSSDRRRDVERELRTHIDLRTEELIAAGMAPEAARRQAEDTFGDYRAIAADCTSIREHRDRERSRRGSLDALGRDLRYGARMLLRRPRLTAVALLTLTAGIGATTGLFSVVYALLLRPLPFPQDELLVRVGEGSVATGESGSGVSIPLAEQFTAESRTLQSGGYRLDLQVQVLSGSEPRNAAAAALSPGAFAALAVAPALGRLPARDEHDNGGTGVVLISYGFWQSHFGSAPDVLERTVQVNNSALPVIGVMPAGFIYPSETTELWLPAPRLPEQMRNRAVHLVEFVGRRHANATLDDVQLDLQRVYERGQQAEPGSDSGHRVEVMPLRRWMVGDSRAAVLMLFAAAALVLLIACANLAGLQLAQVAARRQELAVRTALGAGRWALVRQLATEALLLAAAGCTLGALLAPAVQSLIVASYPGGLPFTTQMRIDGRVLLFAIATGLLAVLLFGLLPAIQAMRLRGVSAIQTGFLRATEGVGRQRARRTLVVAEVALAVVLVMGAALLARSFALVLSKPAGFSAEQLLLLNVSLSRDRRSDQDVIRFYQEVVPRLTEVPGVIGASGSSALPISSGDSHGDLTIEGGVFAAGAAPGTSYRRVLPTYFRTLQIPLIAGREFDARDSGKEPFVVIVNETLARRHFGTPSAALGRRIKVGVPANEPWLTIVGVVGDVRNESLEANDEHATYEPHPQRPWRTMQMVVRTNRDPYRVLPAVRAALRELDAAALISDVSTMTERISGSVAPRRFSTQLLLSFALLALLLAALGIYGVATHMVHERRRELSIRMALGASGALIRRLVFRQAAWLAGLGALLGSVAALVLVRFVRRLLFEVSPADLTSLAATVALLAGVTLLAAYLPARHAAATQPASILRE